MVELQEYDTYKLTSKELLNKRLIDFIFRTCDRGCIPQEEIADFVKQTGYVRMVNFTKSMMRKYMPPDVHNMIKTLYQECEEAKTKLDQNLSDVNKNLEIKKIEDATATQIMEICLSVLFESSLNVEQREGEILTDQNELAKKIRSETPVRLFQKAEDAYVE